MTTRKGTDETMTFRTYTMEFDQYEEARAFDSQKIIEESAAEKEKEKV